MPLTLEVMTQVLPEQTPRWEPHTEAEQRTAALLRRLDGGAGPFSRSYIWQKYLTAQLRERRSWLADSLTALAYPNESLQQAVGYIEIDAAFASDEVVWRATRGTGYFLGVIVYDHRADADTRAQAHGLASSVDMGRLDETCQGIPAVRLAAADVLHAPDPAGATAACWARKGGQTAPIRQILTAKHVVTGLACGQAVAMAGGSIGRLLEFCDGSVDAALIEAPSQATTCVSLPMDIDPVIGMDVHFAGAQTRHVAGKITRTWIFPGDDNAYDPQRIHLDITGVPGDSGALVRLTRTGAAIGIYTGEKRVRSSHAGMAQAIWQAASLLDIELFE